MNSRQTFFRVALPAALVISSVVLGAIGFREHFDNIDGHRPGTAAVEFKRWLNAFYHGVGLPVLQTVAIREHSDSIPPTLEAGRLLGVLAFVDAVGLTVLAFAWRHVVLWWWVLLHRLGLADYAGHALICGLGWKGRQLAEDLKRLGYWVAAVERDDENAFLPWCAANGIRVVNGDASEPETLRAAKAGHAERIYVVCNNDDLALRAARAVAEVVQTTRRAHSIECAVNFQSPMMPPLLRHVAAAPEPSMRKARLRLRAFQTEQATARMFLARYPLDRLRDRGRVGAAARLHICGDGPFAKALLVQAIRNCVFAPDIGFLPTMHCRDAAAALEGFCEEFPCFQPDTAVGKAVPVFPWEIETLPVTAFCELASADAGLLDGESPLFAANEGDRVSVVAALDDGPLSARLVATLAPKLGRIAGETGCDASAFYYFNSPDKDYRDGLERSLDAAIPGVDIKAFTDFLDGCTVAAVEARPLDDLARLLNFHYAAPDKYKALEGAKALAAAEELWMKSTVEEDREFSRSAADHLAVKVRSLGFEWDQLLEPAKRGKGDPEIHAQLGDAIDGQRLNLGRLEHRRWCADHLLSGFRHGPVRRKAEKEHPCLVPWDDLVNVADERTKENAAFYQEQACRMSSVIPRLVADVRDARGSTR